MRQQMKYLVQWPAFHITGEIAEKLMKISPASIDRYLKKRPGHAQGEGGKSHQTVGFPEKPYTICTFYTSEDLKAQAGELLQADVTPYDWFATGKLYALYGFIDDATGKITVLYLSEHE
jgi:hypothetical protein